MGRLRKLQMISPRKNSVDLNFIIISVLCINRTFFATPYLDGEPKEAVVTLEKNKHFGSLCRFSQFKNVLKEFSNGTSKREEIIRLMKCKGM
jgi:hypothetical protein